MARVLRQFSTDTPLGVKTDHQFLSMALVHRVGKDQASGSYCGVHHLRLSQCPSRRYCSTSHLEQTFFDSVIVQPMPSFTALSCPFNVLVLGHPKFLRRRLLFHHITVVGQDHLVAKRFRDFFQSLAAGLREV
jgi:hypothetical protein